MKIRTYQELTQCTTFEERYRYLRLVGQVGVATFGYDRFINQQFYRSHEWKVVRDHVIARDLGRDLGIEGYDIHRRILVHHMNPITHDDLDKGAQTVLHPNYLITTTHNTHNAIHFGDESLLLLPPVERRPGDTKLW